MTKIKRNKIIYWIATGLLCSGMLGSGIAQIIRAKEMVGIITHLGYPLYMMTILGIWKMLAIIAILMPGFKLIKEWAYAGLFFTLTGALISHLVMGDTGKAIAGPVMQTIFIILSCYFRPDDRKITPVNQNE